MTGEDLLTALSLPVGAQVNRRVPKTLLLENGAPTAADRRAVNDGVESCEWVATLKPTTIAVSEYRDAVREYLEINVLRLSLKAEARTRRLIELVHRAVPYPLVLVTVGEAVGLSVAHKRWAQNEAGKTVLDGALFTETWAAIGGPPDGSTANDEAFMAALALPKQPQASLFTVYDGWVDALVALQAARVTGEFRLTLRPGRPAARREALRECDRIEAEIAALRVAASKTKQVSKQVDLNTELRQLTAALAAARSRV